MQRTFKYRLYPNRKQRETLAAQVDLCRELYNAALQERIASYMTTGKGVTWLEQQAQLPAIKEVRPEFKSVHAHTLQAVLIRLNRAFQNFFRRCKSGQTPGYPRFQGRNRYDSFTYPDGAGWKFDGHYLHLTKIGKAKVKLHRPLEGKIKTVTIKREVDQWYVTFSCEMPEPEKLPVSSEDVGIDLGVTHLATLSTGEMIEHPRIGFHVRFVHSIFEFVAMKVFLCSS